MKTIALLLFILFNFCSAFAQDIGKPFLNHYTPKDYNAYSQNWGLVQDKRGVMYVGNFDGVLEYDGATWQLITVSNGSTPNSLAMDENGRVYIAAVGEIGYLSPTPNGKMKYKSLLDKIDKKFRGFQDVLEVMTCKDGIYFNATDRILFYNGDTILVTVAEEFTHSYEANEKYYVHEQGKGLLEGENGKLKLSENGHLFAENDIHAIYPDGEKGILIWSDDPKFVTGKGKKDINFPDIMRNISPESRDFINNKRIYATKWLPNNEIAFLSMQYGGLILKLDGTFVKKLDKKIGLHSEQIHGSWLDKSNGFWFANNSGVSRLEHNSPFRFWDDASGLNSMVLSIGKNKKNGKIYTGTFQGCYVLENDFFRLIPGVTRGVWAFRNVRTHEKDHFFVASSGGLFLEEKNELALLAPIRALSLYHSPNTPDRIYAGTPFGFAAYDFDGEKWQNTIQFDSLGGEIRNFAEDPVTGDFWLCAAYQGVFRLEMNSKKPFNIKKIHHYDTINGLPTNNWVNAVVYQNEVLFTTSKGIYKFDAKKQKFYPDKTMIKEDRDIFRWVEDKEGKIWISGITTQKGEIALGYKQNGNFIWDKLPFKRIPDMGVEAIMLDDDGAAWIGGSEGLFRYDPNVENSFREPYNTLLRKIIVGEDSVIFAGAFWAKEKNDILVVSSQTEKVILPYLFNKIAFLFSATSYEEPTANLFSYKLEGFENEWSAWQKETRKDYTNLGEGKYKFRVKSKNIFGVEGVEASYEFEILPPFYRRWYAYLLYLILASAAILFIIRLNTRRLRRQNEALEAIVKERTAEIVEQKNLIEIKHVELEQQKEEILVQAENLRDLNEEVSQTNLLLEEKNKEVEKAFKDIKSSINYALRIQSAMLPNLATMQKYFKDIFVFFRPRDIVSGDFYWFEHIEEKNMCFFAVADCTGHGVPGAFMSLIGNDLLDKIVLNNQIFEPNKILSALHDGVVKVLRQGENSVRDGMDIGVVAIDCANNKMRFAGAKNALIGIQNGEILVWEGDKQSIGGTKRDENFAYFCHEIDLNLYPDVSFYLFTDGIQDQFGGSEGRKIMKKNLKNWLVEINELSMNEQKNKITAKVDDWILGYEQIDDMLLLGFKV